MKRMALPLILILTGCDPTPPQPETAREPNPVFETQIQAMEKARAVEGQVMEAAKIKREQIDDPAGQ